MYTQKNSKRGITGPRSSDTLSVHNTSRHIKLVGSGKYAPTYSSFGNALFVSRK